MKNRTSLTLGFVLAFSILNWPLKDHQGFADDSADQALLKVISEASLANRSLLSNFACRFRLRMGTSRDVQEAISKGPADNVRVARGLWKLNGDMSTYEISIPKDVSNSVLKKAEGLLNGSKTSNQSLSKGVKVSFPDINVVSDGRRKLLYIGSMQMGTLSQREPQTIDYITPFDMDTHGYGGERMPGTIVKNILEGRGVADSRIEMTDAKEVLITEPPPSREGRETYVRIRFDESKGYLPIEVSIGATGKPPSVKTIVTEAVRCASGAWSPKRSVEISHPEIPRESYAIREIIVEDLSIDAKFTANEMSIEIPKGTVLKDEIKGGQFTLAKSTQLTPAGLEKFFAVYEEAVSKETVDKQVK